VRADPVVLDHGNVWYFQWHPADAEPE